MGEAPSSAAGRPEYIFAASVPRAFELMWQQIVTCQPIQIFTETTENHISWVLMELSNGDIELMNYIPHQSTCVSFTPFPPSPPA